VFGSRVAADAHLHDRRADQSAAGHRNAAHMYSNDNETSRQRTDFMILEASGTLFSACVRLVSDMDTLEVATRVRTSPHACADNSAKLHSR
jgi:hypothetical protein